MNDRTLFVAGVLILVIAACGVVALLVPGMKRVFWIVGLSLALLEFGGIAVGIAFRGISHRDLSGRGLFMLWANGYVAWMIIQYLLKEIARPKVNRPAGLN